MKKISLLLLFTLTLISCTQSTEVSSHEYTGEALGTTYMVRYFSNNELQFEKSLDSIMDEINSSMSTYITKSDISRINRGDTTVKVDENFEAVFNASNKIYKETDGFFDPTVGVLVNAYGFGPGKPLNKLEPETLDSLRNLVGFDKVRLTDDNKIRKEDPAVYLDFNAIAKGYTIDVIGEYLESNNIENYLIELGGELRARGKNLENDAEWVVGIDDPNQQEGNRKLQAKVKLSNAAMATSGNYRKFRVDSITGQKYVHTINPKTGKAERSNLLSASVIAENCMLADGYATAFMALGLERTQEVLNELKGVEVYIMYSSEDGEMEVFQSTGFKKNILE
ncbi:thiamine biosynthesis lipoprotein [Christiangramia gaetbulicola]|uniref:FAD:protein FMN transferase n=1 Tax=Christiangramia gaetbulicola TaxID=703340 RepID=A0A2T6AK62_9FLAO|nr:FAD:protein FMN transferase [Christiangramia gaetbulicola]PTX44215.1 thiamine biosynthesis lipoprotein [Christiangramia gaetbulicola]